MTDAPTMGPARKGPALLTGLRATLPERVLWGVCVLVLCLFGLARPAQAGVQAGGELTFGMSAAFSGPAQGLGVEYQRGIMAAFDHVNAHGGAGGWRLKLSLRDDAYNPATAMRNTIAFVEEERVFALLGYVGTPTIIRALPLLKHYESLSVSLLFPLTGADVLREQGSTAAVYNVRASYLEETHALVEALLAAGRRRVAVFHQADVYGRNGWDGVRRTLRAHELSMVSEVTYRRGAAYTQDFSREAAILLAGKPDAIVTVGTAPACAAMIRDLRDAGFTNIVATLSFADADNLTTFLLAQTRVTGRDYLAGLVFSQVVPCYEDESLPAVRAYRQAMSRVQAPLPPQLSPGVYVPHQRSFVSFEGYLAGMLVAEAVKAIAHAPSRQRLRAAFAGLKSVDLGLGEKLDLRPGVNQGMRRTYLTVYANGHFRGVPDLRAVTQ